MGRWWKRCPSRYRYRYRCEKKMCINFIYFTIYTLISQFRWRNNLKFFFAIVHKGKVRAHLRKLHEITFHSKQILTLHILLYGNCNKLFKALKLQDVFSVLFDQNNIAKSNSCFLSSYKLYLDNICIKIKIQSAVSI